MPFVECPNGHFYDNVKFTECDKCASAREASKGGSVPPSGTDMYDETKEAPFRGQKGQDIGTSGTAKLDPPTDNHTQPVRDGKTIPTSGGTIIIGPDGKPINRGTSPLGEERGLLPVVGWLVVVKGPGRGRDFRLVPGNNYIGRDRSMQVSLDFGQSSDQSVSRFEHALIVHDSMDNVTLITNHSKSPNLPRLNGKRISGETVLQRGDVLLVGNTELMFIPLCGQEFAWANYPGTE